MMNAEAACMTSPRVMVPATYLGAQRRIGMIGANAVAGLRHNRGADVLHHDLAPALADCLECRVEAGALLVLAAEHRDALAIFAQTCERVSVIGLRLVLILGHDDEAARDADHRSAGQHRVDEQRRSPGTPGCGASVLPIGIVSSPPMNHSTPMKVIAEMTAEKTPIAKSTGASTLRRRSSATRYSGLL